jgi:hypothetical protein
MASDPGIPPNSEQLADRLAIQDVLSSHSRGLDRHDSALLQACYWPDAEVDYGAYKGPAHPFAELVIPALDSQYELTCHHLSNTLVEFLGEKALAESCVTAGHLSAGAEQEMLFSGRYLDTLEKRDGRWKILHRQVVMDWSRTHPVQDERGSEAFADLAKGAHGENDPLYTFLQQD